MNFLKELIIAALSVGLVGQFLHFKSRNRKQRAEADVSEFDAMTMQIKHFSGQLEEAYAEIGKMQNIIDRQRDKLVELTRELSEMKIRLIQTQERTAVAEHFRCEVENCGNRKPPRATDNG